MRKRFRTVVVDGSVVPGETIRRRESTVRERPRQEPPGGPESPLQVLLQLQAQARELVAVAGRLDWSLGLAAHMTQVAQNEDALRQIQVAHQAHLAHVMDSGVEPPAQQTQAAIQLVHSLLPLVAAASGRQRGELPVRPFVGMVSDMMVRMSQGPQPPAQV